MSGHRNCCTIARVPGGTYAIFFSGILDVGSYGDACDTSIVRGAQHAAVGGAGYRWCSLVYLPALSGIDRATPRRLARRYTIYTNIRRSNLLRGRRLQPSE